MHIIYMSQCCNDECVLETQGTNKYCSLKCRNVHKAAVHNEAEYKDKPACTDDDEDEDDED